MCKDSLFIPESVKSRNSFQFYFKITKGLSEFRNYLSFIYIVVLFLLMLLYTTKIKKRLKDQTFLFFCPGQFKNKPAAFSFPALCPDFPAMHFHNPSDHR